jgi:hypothetical protein
MDPPSLWLDDQWVAIAVRKMSPGVFLQLKPAVPIGFAAVEAGLARLFPDPEWPLQRFPVLCSLAQLPLIALLVLRLTKRRALAFVAAALLLLDPMGATYAVTVKQYASDGLATVLLLLVGLPLLEQWRLRTAALTAAVALVAILFSFPSCFVSVPLLNLAALAALRSRRSSADRRWWGLGVVVAFDVALLLAYLFLFRHQSDEAMKAYWARNFIPLDSPRAALEFLSHTGWLGLRAALPAALSPLLVLAPVGLLSLALDRSLRSTALLRAAVILGLLSAAALRLYPVATGRTDLFVHPVILILICVGLNAVTRWKPISRVADALLCIAALAALWQIGTPSNYVARDDARIVRALQAEARPEDAVIIYPHAVFAVGYYASWPVEFVRWPEYAHGFDVRVRRPRTLSLLGHRNFVRRPRAFRPLIEEFLATRPPRVLYVGTHLDPSTHRAIQRAIGDAGYALAEREDAPAAQLLVYLPRGARERSGP